MAKPLAVRPWAGVLSSLLAVSALVGCGARTPPAEPAPPVPTQASTHSDALYFILVDRYANGAPDAPGSVDPNDLQAWHGGDIRGIIDHLDEIEALGFGGVWLSPITATRTEPIDEWGAYHGYWVKDLAAVEPRFGTLQDAEELANALRERDMELWLDMVYNHVGYDTPLLTEHPDWFHGLGDIQDWDDPVQAVTHDVHGLPDLAQEKEEVYQHLLAASRTWVERLQPTGFRIDAVRHLPEGFLARLRGDLRETDADLQFLGEVFEGHAGKLAARQRSDQLDRVFDFPLHYAAKDVFCSDAHTGRIASTWSTDRAYDDANALVTFLDNHDVSRITSACGDDLDRVRLAVAFLGASRGTPCLTWGTEVPLTGPEEPENRKDMVFASDQRRGGVYETTRDVLALRARWSALRSGVTRVVQSDPATLVFRRVLADEQVLVAVHLGDAPLARSELMAHLDGATVTDTLITTPSGLAPSTQQDFTGPLMVFVRAEGQPGFGFEQFLVDPPAMAVAIPTDGAELGDGDALLLVGAGDALGNWDPGSAVVAKDGVFHVQAVPGDVLAFKQVIRRTDGSVEWESVSDRYLRITSETGPGLRWNAP